MELFFRKCGILWCVEWVGFLGLRGGVYELYFFEKLLLFDNGKSVENFYFRFPKDPSFTPRKSSTIKN
jgi:hypothetical protein